jgi:hypothetical protein
MIKVKRINIEEFDQLQLRRLSFPLKISRNIWLSDDKLVLEYPLKFQKLVNIGEAVSFSLLPIAYTESSHIELPPELSIEKGTQERIDKICALWNKWFSCNRKVKVFTNAIEPMAANGKERFGAQLFSGGIDSLATFKRRYSQIKYLVFYKGADIPVSRERRFKEVKSYIQDFANEQDKKLVIISTNARYLGAASWEFMALSCTTVGPLLTLSNYINRVYVAATHSGEWAREVRLGSHPDLDPLVNIDRVEIIHDGFELKRIQKLMLITEEPELLQNLRVCQDVDYFDANMHNGSRYNCGKCEKCCYTAMALALLKVTPKQAPFSKESLTLRHIIKFLQKNDYKEKLNRQEGLKIEWAECLELLESTQSYLDGKKELRVVLTEALGKFYDDYKNGFPNGTCIQYIGKWRKLEKALGLKPDSLQWVKKILRSFRGKAYKKFAQHEGLLTKTR